jgi:hypothetical protein
MGLFDPKYAKHHQDDIGNSSFLKKVIRKQNEPVGAFNKRGRREDSVSSEESKEDNEKIKAKQPAEATTSTQNEAVNSENKPDEAMDEF